MHLTLGSVAPVPDCFFLTAIKLRQQRVVPGCLHAAILLQAAEPHALSSKLLPGTHTVNIALMVE